MGGTFGVWALRSQVHLWGRDQARLMCALRAHQAGIGEAHPLRDVALFGHLVFRALVAEDEAGRGLAWAGHWCAAAVPEHT